MTTETVSFPQASGAAENCEPLPWSQRLRVFASVLLLQVKEYATCDSPLFRWLSATLGMVAANLFWLFGQNQRRFKLLCGLHRANVLPASNRAAERLVRRTIAGQEPQIMTLWQKHLARAPRTAATARFCDEPERLLGAATIVLKSPIGNEKGLLYSHYNHVFPLLATYYDLDRIAERYHIAIEPSWSGYCDLAIVACFAARHPVFVAAYEPRDISFLRSMKGNLIDVGVGNNWWVDHRVFCPTGAEKDIDIVMVAGWGSYKRHYRFFEALSKMRRRGRTLRVMLIGYSVGWSKQHVLNQARYYGIDDQLEVHEDVPYEQVNALVNRAKVHILWSRKEGFPRSIIECMFAGVPSIVRKGFNYGYSYPYINDQTGCFADEASLPQQILELVERASTMNPRSWVMEHMSCQRATQVLSERISDWCKLNSECWTHAIATKVTRLHSMQYWDQDHVARFADDYAWITRTRRPIA